MKITDRQRCKRFFRIDRLRPAAFFSIKIKLYLGRTGYYQRFRYTVIGNKNMFTRLYKRINEEVWSIESHTVRYRLAFFYDQQQFYVSNDDTFLLALEVNGISAQQNDEELVLLMEFMADDMFNGMAVYVENELFTRRSGGQRNRNETLSEKEWKPIELTMYPEKGCNAIIEHMDESEEDEQEYEEELEEEEEEEEEDDEQDDEDEDENAEKLYDEEEGEMNPLLHNFRHMARGSVASSRDGSEPKRHVARQPKFKQLVMVFPKTPDE